MAKARDASLLCFLRRKSPRFSALLDPRLLEEKGIRIPAPTNPTSPSPHFHLLATAFSSSSSSSSSSIRHATQRGPSSPSPMAAPVPAPPLRCWADLPGDVLYEILRRVQCGADRGCAALACRPWRDALDRDADPPAPLPWLLLPSRSATGGRFRACCVLSGGAVHGHLRVNPPGARCFGSHDGAWLFLAFPHARVHQLRSVRTGHVHVLPSVFRPFNNARRAGDDMAILAAALSAPPGDATCVAAGIVVRCPNDQHHAADADVAATIQRRLVFWSMGAEVALDFSPGPIEAAMEVEEVVYHDGGFHALTQGEHIYAYTPLLSKPPTIGVAEGSRRFLPGDRIYDDDDDVVLARYLVVSRGELLMVVRYKPSPTQKTSSFRVFQAVDVEEQMPAAANMGEDDPNPAGAGNDDDPNPAATATWSELDTLGGRVLFVGRGCSRAYEANQYPGIEEGVYFLDDSSFYDEFGRIAAANNRTYACVDNGKWSERGVESCFPGQEEASTYSPPAWLLRGAPLASPRRGGRGQGFIYR
ncbi:hypothetical protein ACP70R_004203 [Stipagrostis hirtigluma subsp. patula]